MSVFHTSVPIALWIHSYVDNGIEILSCDLELPKGSKGILRGKNDKMTCQQVVWPAHDSVTVQN